LRNFCLICLAVLTFLMIIPTQSPAKINDTLLKEASLHTVWQSAVALNPKEKVQQMTVLGNHIYILTNSNYLFCLDRNDGRSVFSISAAEAGMPVSQPADFNNAVYFAAANELLAVDLQTGRELFRKKIEFPMSSRPAVNEKYFYLPGMDKQLHVLQRDMFQKFRVNPEDRSGITSVVANTNSIVFATNSGKVYCMDSDRPIKRWQFNAVGAIEASLTKTNGSIYISSKDTNLYKVDANSGTMLWKFYTGSFLTVPARVVNKTVYQYAINKGVYAIDANSGKQIWLSADGADLLAEDANTAYVISKKNICEVMDNASAQRLYTLNFEAVTAFATNPYDSKIYVMEDNSILCIEPTKK
jgi:outer membrane protein assembly factor BamB